MFVKIFDAPIWYKVLDKYPQLWYTVGKLKIDWQKRVAIIPITGPAKSPPAGPEGKYQGDSKAQPPGEGLGINSNFSERTKKMFSKTPDDYDQIAAQLDEELNGRVERGDYGDRDCILWSDPTVHPNRRYNPNNTVTVYLDDAPSKAQIKKEFLGYWFIREL
jgi:hypothetical protein